MKKTVIDWKQFEIACKLNADVQEIACFLRIDRRTLHRACKREWGMPPSELRFQYLLDRRMWLRKKLWAMIQNPSNAEEFKMLRYVIEKELPEYKDDAAKQELNVIQMQQSAQLSPPSRNDTIELLRDVLNKSPKSIAQLEEENGRTKSEPASPRTVSECSRVPEKLS